MEKLKQVIKKIEEYEDNKVFGLKTSIILSWLKEIEKEALDIANVSNCASVKSSGDFRYDGNRESQAEYFGRK